MSLGSLGANLSETTMKNVADRCLTVTGDDELIIRTAGDLGEHDQRAQHVSGRDDLTVLLVLINKLS